MQIVTVNVNKLINSMIINFITLIIILTTYQTNTIAQNIEVSGIDNPLAANGYYIKQAEKLYGYDYWIHTSGNYHIYNDDYAGRYWNIDKDTDDNNEVYFYSTSTSLAPSPISVPSWSPLDGAGTPLLEDTALPVELNSFTAEIAESNVKLNWQTATEVNNYGFEIERKVETSYWSKIGFVEGHGNSNSPKHYEFLDEDVPAEKLEYRLKQIDTDGAFEHYHATAKLDASGITDIRQNRLPTEFALDQNYPNPFNPTTNITYSIPKNGQVQIKVYDMLGNEFATLVNEQKPVGTYEVEFDAKNLSSGVYLYKIVSGNYLETKKMVLLR